MLIQSKYEAQNGCVYERILGGASRIVIARFAGDFGSTEKQRKAEIAAAALNAADGQVQA